VAFRAAHPVLRRRAFFQGRGIRGDDVTDILWFDASGHEMTDATWNAPHARALGALLIGDAITERDPRGEPVRDDSLLILLNANNAPASFALPAQPGCGWTLVLDTGGEAPPAGDATPAGRYEIAAHSLAVLRRVPTAG
jgi:glycogen operon protein